MTDHVALRAGIPPFYVMDVWLAATERQRSHGDLVNLSAGQPSAGAPEPVRAAAASALHLNQLGYTVALGIPELRASIAASYLDRYGLQVEMDDVVVTTGSSGGFCWRSCPASTSATGWRSAAPAIPATATS
jgi:aspartate/methionine/tyrosine aminotransferase